MTMLQHGSVPSTGGYQIERSLRFNSADSAYLNRTPASAGNRKTWTYSAWVKRSTLDTTQALLDVQVDGNNWFTFWWRGSENYIGYDLCWTTNPTNRIMLTTSSVYRDVSAWYHVIIAVDTTQATAANRIRIYVNGSEVTLNNYILGSGYVAQNQDLSINSTTRHEIGRRAPNDSYLNGYMTDIYFIDGQALTPSSFGENDTDTGVWKPKAYSGTYGNNGFYLKFADNSGTTSTTLGKDSSGNGNNWTPNNFSVTAGAGNDSLVDTPTPYGTDTGVGGEVRGNYATLNPLNATPSPSISNGNLYQVSTTSGHMNGSSSTIAVTSGKWYAEVVFTRVAGSTDSYFVGVADATWQAERLDAGGWYGRFWYFATGYAYREDGLKISNNSTASYGASYTQGDVIGIALDMDNGTLAFYKNGVSQGTAYTGITGAKTIAASCYKDASITLAFNINLGQRPFAYTAPSGFKALCTTNLPTPAIGATSTTRADDYFNVVTFTGTGAAGNAVTVGFQPDFVWAKDRQQTGGYHHILQDAVRGANKVLYSNLTNAETTVSGFSFTSTGFTLGTGIGDLNVNGSPEVAWNWKANGAGSSNTQGTITSTVSANTTSGFSIVTYTGTGSNATVGHGLGVAPSLIIVKHRNTVSGGPYNWRVYHRSNGNTGGLFLNTTAAFTSSSGYWNDTSPTSTLFTVGTDLGVNASGGTYVAYCFAPVAGYSAFGSYVSNNSTDGPFVYTGFRPAYVVIKNTTNSAGTSNWIIKDKLRAANYNPQDGNLYANLSNAEDTTNTVYIDFLSNGFKIRGNYDGINGSGNTMIYAAFAENPFKYSLAR